MKGEGDILEINFSDDTVEEVRPTAQLFSRVIILEAKNEFQKRRGDSFVYDPLIGVRPPALDYRK